MENKRESEDAKELDFTVLSEIEADAVTGGTVSPEPDCNDK